MEIIDNGICSLDDMLTIQARVQRKLYEDTKGIEFLRLNVLALIVETSELLQETPWKPWKKKNKRMNKKRLLEESIDILKFLINIWLFIGVSGKDISLAFEDKTATVLRRIEEGYFDLEKFWEAK